MKHWRALATAGLLSLAAAPASAGTIALSFDIAVTSRSAGRGEPADGSFVPRHVSTTAIVDDRSDAATNQPHLSFRVYEPVVWTPPFSSQVLARPSGVVTAVGVQSLSVVHSYLRPPDVGSLFVILDNEEVEVDNATVWYHQSSLVTALFDRPSLGVLDGFDQTDLLHYLEGMKADKVPFLFHEFSGIMGRGAANGFLYEGTALLTGIQVRQVPEPGGAMLTAIGLSGTLLAWFRHRRRCKPVA